MNDAVDQQWQINICPVYFTDRTRLISYYFLFYKGVSILFAIGKTFAEAREKTGVSLEEASADIQIKSVILENIEEIGRAHV